MLRFPPGTPCKLYYDAETVVEPGHYVVSNGGSGYLVKEAKRGKRSMRWNLKCLRCDPKDIPPEAVIHPLFWYRRDKKK